MFGCLNGIGVHTNLKLHLCCTNDFFSYAVSNLFQLALTQTTSSIFIKGEQMNFELTDNDLEASKLYPNYKYTSIDNYLDICLFDPPRHQIVTSFYAFGARIDIGVIAVRIDIGLNADCNNFLKKAKNNYVYM